MDIHQLQEKLSDARTRQKSLGLRTRTAQTQLKVRKFSAESIDQALDRFDHYERRMDDLEGQVAAYDLGRKSSVTRSPNSRKMTSSTKPLLP